MTGSITSTSGYSALGVTKPNYLSWPILKAHAQNHAGEVVLRSADPLDRPLINFRNFDEGSDTAGEDLQSVVAGIRSRASKRWSRSCCSSSAISLPRGGNDEQTREVFANVGEQSFAPSKCSDYVVSRGHYFGSSLGDADKKPPIALLKTFSLPRCRPG